MPEENEPRKHITEALSGRAFVPETHERREEREAAEDYVKGVAVFYNQLQNEEDDPKRKEYFLAERRRCDRLLREIYDMSSEGRQKVISDYSSLLRRLEEKYD